MANDYNFYEDIIKYISQQLDDINASINDKTFAQPYSIALFQRKKNHAFYVTATNTNDGSYVRIFKMRGTVKISFYSSANEKKCEFFKQIQTQGSQMQRMSFLFKGNDGTNKSTYLSDKIGIIEKSRYDFDEKRYYPLEITENYYNDNFNLVQSKIFDIRQTKKSDLKEIIPAPLLEILPEDSFFGLRFKHNSNDPYIGDINDPIKFIDLQNHFLKLYYILCTTKIDNQIQDIFVSLKKCFKDYIEDHPELVSDSIPEENKNPTNPGEEDR